MTFFIIYALFFLLLFVGASALYLIRGGITLAAAISLGFNRGTHFFLGKKDARYKNNGNKIISDRVFIIIYIAIIALIANAW